MWTRVKGLSQYKNPMAKCNRLYAKCDLELPRHIYSVKTLPSDNLKFMLNPFQNNIIISIIEKNASIRYSGIYAESFLKHQIHECNRKNAFIDNLPSMLNHFQNTRFTSIIGKMPPSNNPQSLLNHLLILHLILLTKVSPKLIQGRFLGFLIIIELTTKNFHSHIKLTSFLVMVCLNLSQQKQKFSQILEIATILSNYNKLDQIH